MATFNSVQMQTDISVAMLRALIGILDDIMQEARKISDINAEARVERIRQEILAHNINYSEALKALKKTINESELGNITKQRMLNKVKQIEELGIRNGNYDMNAAYADIREFVRGMDLPKEEEKTLIRMMNESIDSATAMRGITLSPACYNKVMQNLKGLGMQLTDVKTYVNKNNEYHLIYPPRLEARIQAVVRASQCQVNEVDYMPKEDFYTTVKAMVNNPAAAGVLHVNNLSLEVSEKILRESRKVSGLIISSEKQPNGTYSILCYGGEGKEAQKKIQAKLNNLIAKSVFEMTGTMGKSEKIRMQMAHKERKKIEDHVYNLEDNPEGGYIFTLRKTKDGYSVPGYIEFDKDQYIYTDKTLDYSRPKITRRRVQKDQTLDFQKAIMSKATGGDGRHFFISREEFETMQQDLRQAAMLIQDDHDPTASLPTVQAKLEDLKAELKQNKKGTPLYNQILHEKILTEKTAEVLTKLDNPNISKDMTPGLFASEIRSVVYTQYLKQREPKAYITKEDALAVKLEQKIARAKEFKNLNTKISVLKPKRGELAKSISAAEAGSVFDSIKVADYGKQIFSKLPAETKNATARSLIASQHEHFQEAKDVLLDTRIEMKSLEYSIGLETMDRSWSTKKRETIDKNLEAASVGNTSQEHGTEKENQRQTSDRER